MKKRKKTNRVTLRQLEVLKKFVAGDAISCHSQGILHTLKKRNFINLSSPTKKAYNLLYNRNLIDRFTHRDAIRHLREMEEGSYRIRRSAM